MSVDYIHFQSKRNQDNVVALRNRRQIATLTQGPEEQGFVYVVLHVPTTNDMGYSECEFVPPSLYCSNSIEKIPYEHTEEIPSLMEEYLRNHVESHEYELDRL